MKARYNSAWTLISRRFPSPSLRCDPHKYDSSMRDVPLGRNVCHYFNENIRNKGFTAIVQHYCMQSKEAIREIGILLKSLMMQSTIMRMSIRTQ